MKSLRRKLTEASMDGAYGTSRSQAEVVRKLFALTEPNEPVFTFLLALDELKIPTSQLSPQAAGSGPPPRSDPLRGV
jgi:hypothetical protein